MPKYLNHENVPNFINWLEYRIKRIPNFRIYYRSDNRKDFESLFYDSYPMTIFICLMDDKGIMYPDYQALFIMEQVGDRVKLSIKNHPALADKLDPILKEMARDWPEILNLTDLEKACIAYAERDGLMVSKEDFLKDWYDHGGGYYTKDELKRALTKAGKKGLIKKGKTGRWEK